MDSSSRFPYDIAFDRNLGWLTDWEQLALRAKRIAIAGMGGVGGIHLLTLARLGVGAFTIADFDQFEFANFNRQFGATVASVGCDKATVMEAMALAINPELRIRRFEAGVMPGTVDDFLRDADLFVDGFDFFELEIRRQVFARCFELGIPAITAAPIGMGVAFISFHSTSMTFEQYFQLKGRQESEQYVRFLVGLTPRGLHRSYLVDPTRVDLARRKGPSTVAACELCAAVTAAAAVKLLLRRGDLLAAPYNHQFDAYRGRYSLTKLAFGNNGPLQRLKIAVGRRLYNRLSSAVVAPEPSVAPRSPIEEILNLARWAPSGDNSQPWTFRILDSDSVLVQIHHKPGNVYEYRNGEPTWLSTGTLLESMRIAASHWQREMTWEMEPAGIPDAITVRFHRADTVTTDPLLSFITLRSVDRNAYRLRALTAANKSALRAVLQDDLCLDWYENLRDRWNISRLSASATRIRLQCPEAFAVHQRIIDWNHAHSPSGIPAHAVGLSRSTLLLMRWAMARWDRTRWLNRVGGAKSAGWQLDVMPGLRNGAYFVMRREGTHISNPATTRELIGIGGSVQRFWLTATRIGLAMQPVTATLAFARYGEADIPFSADKRLARHAQRLAQSFRQVLGVSPGEVMFIGRIGTPYPRLPLYRSSRRHLTELLEPDEPPTVPDQNRGAP